MTIPGNLCTQHPVEMRSWLLSVVSRIAFSLLHSVSEIFSCVCHGTLACSLSQSVIV